MAVTVVWLPFFVLHRRIDRELILGGKDALPENSDVDENKMWARFVRKWEHERTEWGHEFYRLLNDTTAPDKSDARKARRPREGWRWRGGGGEGACS